MIMLIKCKKKNKNSNKQTLSLRQLIAIEMIEYCILIHQIQTQTAISP